MRTKLRISLLVYSTVWASSLQATSNITTAINQGRAETRAALEAPIPVDPRIAQPQEDFGKQALQGMKGAEKVKIVLKSIQLEGNTIFSEEDLQKFWIDSLNTEVTLTDIEGIAQKIANHYRKEGYFLAQAILPPQDISPKEGKIVIKIVEGTLNKVTVEGGREQEQAVIQSQLKNFPTSSAFNMKKIEAWLLNVRKTPGYDIKPILIASKDNPGATDLILKIEKHKYVDVSFGADNTGNKYTGKYRINGDTILYNTVGRSKTLLATMQDKKGSYFNFYRARQTQFIGNYGTRAYLEYVQSKSRPNLPFGIKSKYEYANLMIMHPIVFHRDTSLKLRVGLDGQNDRTKTFGAPYKEDYIRATRVGILYNKSLEKDFIEFSTILHKGLKGLGSAVTIYPSRVGGKRDFFYNDGKIMWNHQFNDLFSFFAMSGWQISPKPLLASEEFSIGTSNFGRGYELSEISGDGGFGGLLELRLTLRPRPKIFDYIQLYTSFGGGKVYNSYKKTDAVHTDHLSSFAVGIRTSMFKHLNLSVEEARPLSRVSSVRNNKNWRLTAKATLRFSFEKDFTASANLPK